MPIIVPMRHTPSDIRRYTNTGRVVCGLMVVLAIAFTAKLAVFSCTVEPRWSIAPAKPFFVSHWCPLAWTVAVDRARAGENVYLTHTEDGPVVSTDPDPFLYTPMFLLGPRLMLALTNDSMLLRSGWFAFQVATTLAALVFTSVLIGGAAGARALWLIPAVWVAPPFLMGLQIGNPHVTVLAAALLGVLLLRSSWWVTGAGLLAVAVAAKVFPGILLLYLAAQRQWRAVAACAVWLAMLTTLSVLWFGTHVVTDYIAALPGIQSGVAVAEFTENRDIVASNQSVYGATRKLAAIGIERFTPARGQLIQTLYGGAVLVLALVLGLRSQHRGTHSDRLTFAIVCLALLNLASFRSPFLPDAYAFVGTFWLCSLIVARSDSPDWRAITRFVILWIAMAPIWGGLDVRPEPYVLIVAFSLMVQASVFALNLHSARS